MMGKDDKGMGRNYQIYRLVPGSWPLETILNNGTGPKREGFILKWTIYPFQENENSSWYMINM